MRNIFGLRIGFVIIGFNNPDGIRRILASLDKVNFDNDEVLLIFSIDYSGKDVIRKISENYIWNHGEKIIKSYNNNLGLKRHILRCGDYIEEYNLDALVVLEDDIMLAPNVYNYILKSTNYYKDKDYVAGISLYKHEIDLNAKHPFYDFKDGYDVYFMQYAQSWGQVWLKKQWKEFKNWYTEEKWKQIDEKIIPSNIKKWKNSWLKFHIMYCIDCNKYFIYPRVSETTNFSDVGVHGTKQITNLQVCFDCSNKKDWIFPELHESKAIYDAFFQNIRVLEVLDKRNVTIDYYGVKELLDETHLLLTIKKYNYEVVKSWGLQLRPIEANIVFDIKGDDIKLYNLDKIVKNKKNNHERILFRYDIKGMNIITKENPIYCLEFIFDYVKKKVKRIVCKSNKKK